MNTTLKTLALTTLVAAGLVGGVGCDRNERAQNDRDRNEPVPGRTAGQELDDKTLTANVKAALMADSVKYPDMSVQSYKGVVQLSGFVDSKEQKDRAGDVAGKVAGVSKVENNVTVKEKKS